MKKNVQKVCMFVILMITTAYGLSAQDVLNETFENGFEANGWTQSPTSATVSWTTGSSGVGSVTPYQGNNMAKLYSNSRQDSVRLISKSLDVTGILEPTLDFYIASPKFGTATTGDSLRVYFKIGEDWKVVKLYVTNSAAWQQKSIRIKDYIENYTTFRIAFEWVYGNGKGIALDNIMVYGKDACTTPVNMRATNVTGDAARLMWNTSQYTVSNRIKIFASPVENASQIETDPALIDTTSQFSVYEARGLTPETSYYWYVKSTCSASDISEWSPVGELKTLCATQPIPTGVDSFDSYAVDAMPTCWTSMVNLIGEWETATSIAQFTPRVTASQSFNAGGKSLSISSALAAEGKSTVAYAVSPRFNVESISAYQLKFKLKSSSVNHVLSVGTMTDAHNQTSFVETKNISVAAPNVWQDVTVFLRGAANNAKFFAFKVDGSDGQGDEFFIDELEVLEIPTCATPVAIVSSNLTRTDVTLSWEGNSAAYEIKVYQTLSNPATDTPVASVQNVTPPYTLTGLQHSNSYHIYIKGNCNSEWSQPLSIKTERGPTSMPFFDDFESDLGSWDLSNGVETNKWHVGTAVKQGGNKSLYISKDNGVTNSYDIAYRSYVYAKRLFDLKEGKEYSLSFDWKGMGESVFDVGRAFLVPTDKNPVPGTLPGNTATGWIEISQPLFLKDTWQRSEKDSITVPADGEYYLVFSWRNNIGRGEQPPIAIDNVRFLEPTCGRVQKTEAKHITDNSATITWLATTKGTPTQYSVYVVSEGDDYTTATPQVTTDTTVNLTGLLPLHKYDIYIITNCSATEGNSEPAVMKFTTNQSTAAIPYFENFEGATTSVILENGNQTNKWTVGTADHNGTGSKSMYISKNGTVRGYDKTNKSFVYSYTTFELSNGEIYKLKFDWKSYGKNSSDILNVFLVPDDKTTVIGGNENGMNYYNDPPDGWIKIVDKPLFATNTEWQTIDTTFRLATQGRYKLVFFWKNTSSDGNESGAAAIDNISLNTESCPTINAIRTETTGSSLNISWATSASATSWGVAIVSPENAGSVPTAFTNVTNPSYTITPATPNTAYEVYIYANCTGNAVSDTLKYIARTAATIPFTANFENKNNDGYWTLSSSLPLSPTLPVVNKWTIGTGANNGGSRGMYISSNNSTNEYDNGLMSIGYAYVLLDMEQDAEYLMMYDWKAVGQTDYDYLRAFIIPESYTGIATGEKYGISATSNNMPANWIAISRMQLSNSENWISVDTLFSVKATGKYYLAFFWENNFNGGNNPPAAIDNVSLSKVLCKRLNNIVVSNVAETGAKISWDVSADAASYEVKLSTSEIDPETTSGNAGHYPTIADNYIDLSGNLTAGTLYYAYVRANCSNGNNSPYRMVRFSTLCEIKNIPYSDNFDSYNHEQKLMPACWSSVVYKSDIDSIDGDFVPFVDAKTVGGEETKFLNIPIFYKASNGAFSSSFAILPQIVEPINTTMLSFKAKIETGTGKISVGAVSDINDAPTTFIRLGEYDLTTEYQNYLVPLDGFSGPANSRIVIVVEGDKLQKTNSVFVDDLGLDAINSCVVPTGINHTFVRNDSAILKWSSIYTSARTFQVIVSTEDVGTDFNRLNSLTPAQTAFNQNVTGDSVVVTGLAESTTYYYYIRMVCDNNTYSSWFDTKRTFTTSCRESNKCKLLIKTKDANGRGWGSAGSNPKLLILNSKDVVLGEYRVKQSILYGASSDTISLDSLILCSGEYVAAYHPGSSDTYNSFELILDNTPLYVSQKMANKIFLINFTIDNGCVGSVCSVPENIKIAPEATSANITWTGNANGYDIKVYENSFTVNPDDPSQTPVFSQNNVATTSVVATGLRPRTDHAVFVRSVCTNSNNVSNSNWQKTVFTTGVYVPLETLPFATDFENDADNAKWTIVSSEDTRWIIDSAVAKQGAKSLYISQSGNEYSYDNTISYSYAVRKFSMTANATYSIDFDWKSKGDVNYDLARAFLIPSEIANITDANPNGMTWSNNNVPQGWIAVSNQLVSSENWKHSEGFATVPADGEYLFALFWKNDDFTHNNPPAAIDNVSIVALTCSPPKDLTLSNVSSTSADLAWTGNVDKYTVRVYQTNEDTIRPDTHTNFVSEIPNITTTSTSITGLTANTNYYLFVRGACGAENSRWNKIELRTHVGFAETTVPFTTGFEDNADNAKWFFSDRQTNQWIISNGVSNSGTKAMYVTNSTVAPFANEYSTSATRSFLYAYRKVELSANDVYTFSFDWRSEGETPYDFGRVFLVPISYYSSIYGGADNGVTVNMESNPEGWIDIGGTNSSSANVLEGQNTWQSATREDIVVPTTGSYLLTFFWKNDDYGVQQPPLAIDNVSMSKLDCAGVVGQITLKKENNSIVVNWIGGSDSYEVKLFDYVENFDIATATPIQEATVTTTTHTFGAITNEGVYWVAVKGHCGTLTSEWKTASILFMQTENLPISTDFQNSVDNQKWRYSHNGTVNKWAIGEAVGNEDSKSIYISRDDGVNNVYNPSIVSSAYAYRTASLEASKSYVARFFWKAKGESNYDLLRAFIIPASANIADGNDNDMSGSDNTTPAGWIDIASPEGKLNAVDIWTKSEKFGITVPQDGAYHLAFFWKNGGFGGLQSPAAVDNFVFKEIETVELTDKSCLGEPYTKNRFDIPVDSMPAAGVYNFTTAYDDPNGNYQIIKLTLTVINSMVNTVDSTVCAGVELDFFGRKIVATTSGEYKHYAYSISTGCDSVIRLNLTVNPSYTTTTNVEVTSLPATVGNRTFPAGYPNGEYTVTVPGTTALGCDSTTTYNVKIDVPVGLNGANVSGLTIAPNPIEVGQSVEIRSEFSPQELNGLKVEVLNTAGSVLSTVTPKNKPIRIDGFRVSGVYVIRLTTGTGNIVYGKVIVK